MIHFHRFRPTGRDRGHSAGFKNGTFHKAEFACRCGETQWRWVRGTAPSTFPVAQSGPPQPPPPPRRIQR